MLSNLEALYPRGIYRTIAKTSISVRESMECRKETQYGMRHSRFLNSRLVYGPNSKRCFSVIESMECRKETHSGMRHPAWRVGKRLNLECDILDF